MIIALVAALIMMLLLLLLMIINLAAKLELIVEEASKFAVAVAVAVAIAVHEHFEDLQPKYRLQRCVAAAKFMSFPKAKKYV